MSAEKIDTCIRKVAIACFPVLEKLIQKMQKNELVCFDETSGHEKDLLKRHGAVITISNAEFFLATRNKVEWLQLITKFCLGWLLTDRAHEDRQNALVHLIRNAQPANSGSFDVCCVEHSSCPIPCEFIRDVGKVKLGSNEMG